RHRPLSPISPGEEVPAGSERRLRRRMGGLPDGLRLARRAPPARPGRDAMSTTLRPIEPPENPTRADWIRSVRSANALPVIELGRRNGLIEGGPEIDVVRSSQIVRAARAAGVVVPVRSLYRVLEELNVQAVAGGDGEGVPALVPCSHCKGCGRVAEPSGDPWI